MVKKFKCIRNWARNSKGDIVEEYEWKRYPKEVQDRCFEEIKESAPKPVSKVSIKPSAPITVKPAGTGGNTAENKE